MSAATRTSSRTWTRYVPPDLAVTSACEISSTYIRVNEISSHISKSATSVSKVGLLRVLKHLGTHYEYETLLL